MASLVFKTSGQFPQPVGGSSTSDESSTSLGRLLGALAAELAPRMPDLANVVEAWQTMPEAVRAGIVAMAKASANNEGGG